LFLSYLIKRIGLFFLIVWLAATVNFFLPRISGQSPVQDKLMQQAVMGGYQQAGMQQMVDEYSAKFGLDKPLLEQYVTYLGDMARFDFNYSISNYPKTVKEMMAEAVPWSVGLLLTTTLLAFALGTLLGALLAWPRTPRILKWFFPPLILLHAIPYYLFGMVLTFLFAFQIKIFPIFGGYSAGTIPSASLEYVGDVLAHAILPASAMILVAIGGWALGMRAMMITTEGEDFMVFGEAKGLKSATLFMRYALRNALLPQTTSLALALGHIISGAVLVETVFAYPGIGTVLYHAIREGDHYLIQGIVFSVIVTLGIATLILDLIYPILDPRITYRRA
jgi:peptide/nickel transport system permease protein